MADERFDVYDEFLEMPAWPVVQRAIEDLIGNQDLDLRTPLYHVVGYTVKQLSEAGVLATESP